MVSAAIPPLDPEAAPVPANLPYAGPAYPDRAFPVLYADSVYSLAHGNGHVKFYLARLDPSIVGDGTSMMTPFAQVVMPMKAFATTALFFEAQLKNLIKAGQLDAAEMDAIRREHFPE